MTNDGINAYTWNRANRLKQVDIGTDTYKYGYDGNGHRISQDVNSIVTQYLNDVQPGLVKMVAATTGANTERFIHGPRGIQAMEDRSQADSTPIVVTGSWCLNHYDASWAIERWNNRKDE